jgi:ATP-dependent RNA helicase RhlE
MGLDQRLLDSIKDAKYIEPTPIQAQAIPVSMKGQDVLGLAQTGTGKTAAFMLPILDKIHNGSKKKISALIIAPTRELVDQINKTAIDLGKYTKSSSVSIYGGVNKRPQDSKLSRHPDIVVACPGRLLDHLNEKTIDLSGVETLVLDEADTMCDMGFLPDIRKILNHLPIERQTLFFAATMPKDIRALTQDILKSPKTVQIGIISPAETVSHALYPMTEKIKTKCLFKVLETTATGRVILFTRTKHRTKRIAADLGKRDYKVTTLQGNLSQNKRNSSINGFKNGKYDILVATDIASRGIDVSEVSHVINFDMPNTVDTYINRIGRTGRAKNKGEALTFVVPGDEYMVRRIEAILKAKIDRRTIDDIDYGKTAVRDPNSKEHPRRDGDSQYKGNRKGRYTGASNARRNGAKGKTSTNSHRFNKNSNSNNLSVNTNRDPRTTKPDNKPGSK